MTQKEPAFIQESKRLCEAAGMNPEEIPRPNTILNDSELEEKRKSYQEILAVVRFFSNKLLHSLKGTPILVAVADAEGYLLEIEGDETIRSTIEQFGIFPGSLFKQEDTGTNVISLSLEQERPISLIGTNHYHSFLQGSACYGATFRYTDNNNLLGSLSLMMPIEYKNPLFLTMLSQVVDSIERELLLRKQNRQLNIMNQIMLSRTRNGIVITDETGRTTEFNEFAQQISGNTRESVIGRNIQDSPITGDYFKQVLEEEKTFTNEILKFTGDDDHLIVCLFDAQPIYEGDELAGAFGQFRDITDRYNLQEQYNYLAFHDDLTGLPNRRYIRREIKKSIDSICQGHSPNLALLFIDLDRFKIINDNFGHSCGDSLLAEVAKRLEKSLGPDDILARMGGDEFIFLLRDFQEEAYATEKAEMILESLHHPFTVQGDELYTTASIGIVHYPDTHISAETLMIHADNAMYQAKSDGKDRYVVYTPDSLENMMEEYRLEADLRGALENKEFVLHYQPQIKNETGEVIGVEALIRWNHPKFGLLSPAKFISLAEKNGLITQIGEWVLEEACIQNKKWQEAGGKPIKVSVNMSTQQFLTHNTVSLVEQVLHRTGLDPQYLVLEITEYMAMEHDNSFHVLEELRELGIGISIDDFGTGYSSLNYLKDFRIDYIKIDKSFVHEVLHDENDAIIVNAIISLAHNLGMQVIAEGVETAEQLAFLIRQDCDMTQGYFFSKPLTAEGIEKSYVRLKD
ncbi:EAL domain-containing protein [Salimicrobium halophilum]|uniref:PAS domain S-box-containing protein/diguanylate cyclase (GGDEF) domain-containing protein n=1 Tax=Salimicrobium halophilum TaxID=86666 RepID=A0A1G8S729_9BACI|nr:EAL domain-containing protein [Salimicrobium halophilum]SDJ25007.1 PAS domain S-box-containing protein/diguanylate cyclase (GGDEF) domain-containing protein [Salimicrobium halophilum]